MLWAFYRIEAQNKAMKSPWKSPFFDLKEIPMDITMGFFRLQFAETKQVPRVTRAAPVKEARLGIC